MRIGRTVNPLLDLPAVLAVASFIAMTVIGLLGVRAGGSRKGRLPAEREDVSLVLGAALTLLGLIIGFSFAMAVERFDQRRASEEGEANAIGTALARADLLGADEAAAMKTLLRQYAEQRARYYTVHGDAEVAAVRAEVRRLQDRLWAAAVAAGRRSADPMTALVVSGTNDVLNAEGVAHAAWTNRIPAAAWWLMTGIALIASFLAGYSARNPGRDGGLLLTLPLLISLAFLLIADIESPRDGFIRIAPDNLRLLMQ